jgi:hypothetical protein
MHKKFSTTVMLFPRRVRLFLVLLFSAGLVGGLGCATLFATSELVSGSPEYYNKPILTDTVFALARPDARLAKKIGSADAIIFLGKKNTYLLIEGGNKLLRISSELDGGRVKLDDRPKQLFRKDRTAWGSLRLNYAPAAPAGYSPAEIKKLGELGFKPDNSGIYILELEVKAAIQPPVNLSSEELQQFKNTHEIAFYNPPTSSPPPDLGAIAMVPVAIAIDAATIEIQTGVLGLVVVLGMLTSFGN